MTKTIYDTFKDFPAFWIQLKSKFVRDSRAKNQINNLFFSNRIYDYCKHDTYYGTSDEALNRIFTQITFDCAEFSKKEALHFKIYEKVEKYWEITTRTEERKQNETTQTTKPPKTITTQNEPILSLSDLSQSAFGAHSRADLLKTTQKHTGADTTTTTAKGGYKVVDKEGKTKINPNWTEVESQSPAGLSRILACFASLEIDLSKYLARYRKFFYSSYGLEGKVEYIPGTKRHIFKSWEEIEEEQKPDEEKSKLIPTEEPELSYNEWKKKFKEENPGEKPTYQLYTIERLERRKAQLEKELKKTSGVFKDKINLRLTFNECLIEGFKKEIKVCEAGNPDERLSLSASDEQVEQASFWAKINRVVGFKEFKKMIASFVRGYNRLTEKKIDKPCQMYLLLGPPGVGKSFISEMLAEAMDLPIEVISMNGKKESSIFFGVPQEWAGAGVGEILKAMIKHKSRVVIILLDEFEKCDKAVQQVLGNLTDETLNKKFKDVFFDFPVPINEVIFFCTANYPEDIEPFLLSRLTRVKIEPLTFAERLEVAWGLIDYNFAKYEVSDLKANFSLELIKKCLCKEWGVRQLKGNIQRLAYEVFLLKGEGLLPDDWLNYEWPLVQEEEVDAGDPKRGRPACPYFLDRNNEHRSGCECFKPDLVPGWRENMND